ncbi:hypothetical protein ACI2K4_23805 [Micromonospora sp. NPDC050397]|uniref:hypothetical protein n=1 Tax=Micromonospora sp. NPDC050397 TaxID=3364279 RepID=UPI00384B581B
MADPLLGHTPAPAGPPQIPIEDAAKSPIGLQAATRVSKIIDVTAVVVAPILVPAFVLATVRFSPERAFISGFTLSDIAFSIVSVAFAALTRALTGRGESWKLVAMIGIFVIVFETAIAVSRDTMIESDNLLMKATQCQAGCDLIALHSVATQITANAPPTLLWMTSTFLGALLCSISVYAILSES